MSRLRLLYLRWREEILVAQVENGRALMRDHAARLAIAERELAKVRRLQMAATPAQDVLRSA